MIFFYLILSLLPFIANCDECKRPEQLMNFEDACKTDPEVTGKTGTFLENLQENIAAAMDQTRKLVNMAKKRLGIKYEEKPVDEQPKKCEYYQCIFRKMDALGANNYPNMTSMENWINANVDDSLKQETLMKATSCFNALALNMARDEEVINIRGDDDGSKLIKSDNVKPDYEMDDITVEANSNVHMSCDVSSKLMTCLDTDMKCSAFKYP